MKLSAILNLPIDVLFRHFDKMRIIELGMACAFLGEGILLVLSPTSIQTGAFRFLLLVLGVNTITAIFFLVAITRIVALVLNGHWMPYGAYMRAAGAAVGALMIAQMAAALVTYSTHGNTLPFGAPFFGVWALLETVLMYWALLGAKAYNGRRLDVGNSDHIALAASTGAVPFSRDPRRSRDNFARSEGIQIRPVATARR